MESFSSITTLVKRMSTRKGKRTLIVTENSFLHFFNKYPVCAKIEGLNTPDELKRFQKENVVVVPRTIFKFLAIDISDFDYVDGYRVAREHMTAIWKTFDNQVNAKSQSSLSKLNHSNQSFATMHSMSKYLDSRKGKRILIITTHSYMHLFIQYEDYMLVDVLNTPEDFEKFQSAEVFVTTPSVTEWFGINLSKFDEVLGFRVKKEIMTSIWKLYEDQVKNQHRTTISVAANKVASTRFGSVTPVKLELILHYHYRDEPYPDPRSAPAIEEAIRFWLAKDMIALRSNQNITLDEIDGSDEEYSDYKYNTTEKGKIYIEALCQMPLPVPTWKVPISIDRGTE